MKSKIYVGMASVPWREKEMLEAIDSLYNQVDKFYIYLNNYPHVPKQLKKKKIKVFTSQKTGDQGAKGKFFDIKNVKGYYFSVDDDIIYPSDYVEKTIRKLEEYKRECVVSYHGSIIPSQKISVYYLERVRYKFSNEQTEDIPIHVPGTGVTAFHTDTLKLKFEDFFRQKYLDISFGILCQERKVPIICLQREKGWILPSKTVDYKKSLYVEYERNQQPIVELINQNMPWKFI